jgi:hypothetical protein
LSHNAVAAPVNCEAQISESAGDELPRVARLKRYCCACGEIWDSVEAPAALMDDLFELPDKLEDARRQIAMLRLLLARDRREIDDELRQTIPLRRAA